MGMLSDFLTLIKGTQTNINGVVIGKNGKIDSSAVDSTPTANSTNLVTSGGVKRALDTLGGVYWGKISLSNNTKVKVTAIGSGGIFLVMAMYRSAGQVPTISVVGRYSGTATLGAVTETSLVTGVTSGTGEFTLTLSATYCDVYVCGPTPITLEAVS